MTRLRKSYRNEINFFWVCPAPLTGRDPFFRPRLEGRSRYQETLVNRTKRRQRDGLCPYQASRVLSPFRSDPIVTLWQGRRSIRAVSSLAVHRTGKAWRHGAAILDKNYFWGMRDRPKPRQSKDVSSARSLVLGVVFVIHPYLGMKKPDKKDFSFSLPTRSMEQYPLITCFFPAIA